MPTHTLIPVVGTLTVVMASAPTQSGGIGGVVIGTLLSAGSAAS